MCNISYAEPKETKNTLPEPAAVDTKVPGPSQRGTRISVATPKKAGRLRSQSEKYCKAFNRLKGLKSHRKVTKQEALQNFRDYVTKDSINCYWNRLNTVLEANGEEGGLMM